MKRTVAIVLTWCLLAQPLLAAEKTIFDLSYEGIIRYAEQYPAERTKAELGSWKHWIQEQRAVERREINGELSAVRASLKEGRALLRKSANPESELRCQILRLERQERELLERRRTQVKVLYQNRLAKLKLLERWPQIRQELDKQILTGAFLQRPHADAEDMGVRTANAKGQWKDQRLGQDAWEELRQAGVLPPELVQEAELDLLAARTELREADKGMADARTLEESKAAQEQYAYAKAWVEHAEWYYTNAVFVKRYFVELTGFLRDHSDMRVPAQVYLFRTPQVNAFALPGGILAINTGLLWTGSMKVSLIPVLTEESQLAGIVAHEMAHVSERHWRDIAKWATIMNVAAQIALTVVYYKLAGNKPYITASEYYAMQGIQMLTEILLAMGILKVSRGAEAEADQLAVQTLWHAGYEPLGFLRAFDMITALSGPESMGWFASHPSSPDRMIASKREALFLSRYPAQAPTHVVDTSRFQTVRNVLREMLERRYERERGEGRQQGMPSLQRGEEGCRE